MYPRVILTAQKQQKIIAGHPWVFPQAIQNIQGQPEAGDWVEVFDNQGAKIGGGFFNPHSLYRVRMIAHYQDTPDWQVVLRDRIKKTFKLRQTLNFPNSHTNCYRLCNSESDGLSGLIIDVFHNITVISSSAFWTEHYRELILDTLKKEFPNQQFLWFGQAKPLAQDGWLQPHRDEQPLQTIVKEAGVQFQIRFDQVQKTGIFLDQRENHQRVAELCRDKKVLDLYTYHGGFALHAAMAGAKQVTAVDSSAPAIEHAKQNALLNDVSQIDWVVDDAKHHLEKAKDYDVVILDPPKLVPSKKHLHQAKNLYRFLHRQLFRHMKSGSILMTCNCSSALNAHEFTNLVAEQAIAEHREMQVLGVYGPSICHPVLPIFPEGHYLTAVLVYIQ
ncbi:MAG: rRNA (cytosine1962-C5)-methyltransferase [Pseudomonadota bacterium]|nr:rRNA (cytosine1962-C5)-methyltransferase [Pseudomonadota bacterium]